MPNNEKQIWIYVCKTFAIIGVILQHVLGYAYTNERIFYGIWWAVALFIMISGYNAYSSYINRGAFRLKKKLMGIIFPYLIATLIYTVYREKCFDATTFLNSLVHFDASGPFYYVSVYIQLLILTPFLVGMLTHLYEKIIGIVGSWILVVLLAYFSTNYTNIFDIIIGGGYLFAGPWLVFWFLGMNIRHFEEKCRQKSIHIKRYRGTEIALLTIMIVMWQYTFVNKGLNFRINSMFKGEQVRMTWGNAIETIIIFVWIRLVTNKVIEYTEIFKPILFVEKLFELIGEHTLDIFLYHGLFIEIFVKHLETPMHGINRWLFLFGIVVSPIMLGIIINYIKACCCNIIKDVRIE